MLYCTPAGTALIEKERDHLWETDGFPDWDYTPPNDEGKPFEYKPSDWAWLRGSLVALDYSSPALF